MSPDEPVIDITPYLGKHLMTRHTDLTITAMNMFSFPIDRDLDVETVTIKSDPQVEHGIIMSSSDGMYRYVTRERICTSPLSLDTIKSEQPR